MTAYSRSQFTLLPEAMASEWLVTNGLGGFASGTVSQAHTRRYHGLLIASLHPPVQRVVMVSKLEATVHLRGRAYELGCNEFSGGTIAPRGLELLSAFASRDGLPAWTYALGDAHLEQMVWMADGRNTTYVRFSLTGGTHAVTLDLLPLCTYRDYHSHARGGWTPRIEEIKGGCRIIAFPGARPYCLTTDRGRFAPDPDWYWNFYHRAEAERGLDATEDLFRPGRFRVELGPEQSLTLVASAETDTQPAKAAFEQEHRRRRSVLQRGSANAPAWVSRLRLAADQFIVRRADAKGALRGTTVIAGYPWFSDWGRDTMIALPGLTLATGRLGDAADILRTFAEHVSDGMLPNRFPDGGEAPEYNTVDATLWYFHALSAYLAASNDRALLQDLYPTLKEIVTWHERGTRFGIRVDPADGLLFAGEPGVQLTWMDAKVGDWVVTPRIGKPVEINALWHYALVQMAGWARWCKDSTAASAYQTKAERVAASFGSRFWFDSGQYLLDVIDSPDSTGDGRMPSVDASVRPNQILAVSLAAGLLDVGRARAVVDRCGAELLTPVGLRSLSPHDCAYRGRYVGGPRERDAAYHQGTVWSWLLGPFALAHYSVYSDAAYALALLEGLAPHLDEGCVGTISEIMDGDAPHAPRGCVAQAWSVGETLRAYEALASAQSQVVAARTVGAET